MPRHNIPYVNIPAQAEEQMADLLPIFERVVRRGSYVGTEEEVQKLTDEFIGKIEGLMKKKETEILTV